MTSTRASTSAPGAATGLSGRSPGRQAAGLSSSKETQWLKVLSFRSKDGRLSIGQYPRDLPDFYSSHSPDGSIQLLATHFGTTFLRIEGTTNRVKHFTADDVNYAADWTPDDRYIVLASWDHWVYLLDRNLNLIWKRKTNGGNKIVRFMPGHKKFLPPPAMAASMCST